MTDRIEAIAIDNARLNAELLVARSEIDRLTRLYLGALRALEAADIAIHRQAEQKAQLQSRIAALREAADGCACEARHARIARLARGEAA